ncbi:hypothetical protein EUGRSUZ_H02906 [Eucalyptus grandis]|uniref:Uncharacterized protein n=2 Tax=Eucalyptus grandis TaxID=71139 RepID=A0ACC3JVB3_EUCGR|nr:hypothetical protein EUGRSUZ_H02906 [Eucalyptus grandis]
MYFPRIPTAPKRAATAQTQQRDKDDRGAGGLGDWGAIEVGKTLWWGELIGRAIDGGLTLVEEEGFHKISMRIGELL